MRVAGSILDTMSELVGTLVGPPLRLAVASGMVHFPFLTDVLGRIPFSPGFKLRRAIYARILPRIGRNVILHPGVVLEDPRTSFGDDVWISHACYLDYATIGDHVLVGPHAVILAGGRPHQSERVDIPIKLQPNNPKQPVTLGSGCWVGANATVMADVGHDAIVGAGSVVTRPVPPFAVVAGNPARVLRMRGGAPSA
jgi:acetyltransferase-like isoleucine patch superfamily enzyme